jgi:hypothetical protein
LLADRHTCGYRGRLRHRVRPIKPSTWGAVFDNSPIEPTVIAVQFAPIYFDAPCKYCRNGRRASTNIRPVDSIGRPAGDANVCGGHAKQLVERARTKGLAVEMRD